MDLQLFNSDGTPALDEAGNFIYEPYIEPNWSRFRLYFSINVEWIMYTNKIPPFFSSALTSLILQPIPDINAINNIIRGMINLVNPPTTTLESWQSIADICNTGIVFLT